METKILKVVYRMDGKYDCELAVIGSTKNVKICLSIEDVDLKPLNDSLQKFLTDHPTVIEQAKALEKVDEPTARWKGAGMGDYTCTQCDNTISGKPKICPSCQAVMMNPEQEQSPEAQQAACDAEQCSFPECDHVYGYSPDKDDPDPYPCTDPQCYDAGNYHVSCPGGCPKHK